MNEQLRHRLLQRQLRRHWGRERALPDGFTPLLRAVEEAYLQADDDRATLERSLELSSQELLASNAQLLAILQGLPDLFLRLDADGRILDCNSGDASDLFRPKQEMIGRRIWDFPEAAIASDFERAIREVREGRQMSVFDYSVGEPPTRYYEARIVPLGEDQSLAIIRNVTEARRAELELQHRTLHDPLTELPNLIFFQDQLDKALSRARRQGQQVGILCIDLDRFKTINDTLGHTAGDALLGQVAHRLQRNKRLSDTLARVGGDEFLYLVEDLRHPSDLIRVAQSLLESLEAPFLLLGHQLRITASIGLATFPNDGASGEELVSRADVALYRAKATGGSTCRLYQPQMNESALDRLMLENELRRAIAEERLLLHFQPQFSVTTGLPRGVEALVRWPHPDGSLRQPGEFIPLAEMTGTMPALGMLILHTACREWQACEACRTSQIRLAVNVSPYQLRQPDFIESVDQILRATQMDPRLLELEVTESGLVESGVGVEALVELRSRGIGIALDDFGTGHSSLSSLKNLPVTAVKIDRSFVAGCATDPRDASIVQAVTSIARHHHLRVIAEGVEHPEQLECLREWGCDEAQGFLLARPADLETLRTADRSGLSVLFP